MPPSLALPSGRFENPGAGLEPQKSHLRREETLFQGVGWKVRWIWTISGILQVRTGGPQVPRPQET